MANKLRQMLGNKDFFSLIFEFFTKETMKMAAVQFRVAAFIKCAPFELEGKSVFGVKMFQSRWRLLAWHIANWIYSLQTAFLWISFTWKICTEPFGEELMMHLFYVVAGTMGWVFMTAMYLKPRECLFMLNQYGSVIQTAKDADIKIPHWASHYFVILAVYYFAFCALGTWFVQAVMFMWQPTSSKHIYAYLPLNWQQNPAVFAVALLHKLSWTAWYVTLLALCFCYWCADVFTMNDILTTLSSKEMTTKDHVKLYRYLQLFCILFNDYNGSFLTVGFTTMLVASPIVFIFLALTAADLNLLIYMVLIVVSCFSVFLIMYFIPQYSKVRLLSANCVKILRCRAIKPRRCMGSGELAFDVFSDAHRKMILKKRMRALAPLGIRIWFFGVYTIDLSQELMNQLFNNIILLLSL